MDNEPKQAVPVDEQPAGTPAPAAIDVSQDKSGEAAETRALPVDYRRVEHGHGPCSCCGPYSE